MIGHFKKIKNKKHVATVAVRAEAIRLLTQPLKYRAPLIIDQSLESNTSTSSFPIMTFSSVRSLDGELVTVTFSCFSGVLLNIKLLRLISVD